MLFKTKPTDTQQTQAGLVSRPNVETWILELRTMTDLIVQATALREKAPSLRGGSKVKFPSWSLYHSALGKAWTMFSCWRSLFSRGHSWRAGGPSNSLPKRPSRTITSRHGHPDTRSLSQLNINRDRLIRRNNLVPGGLPCVWDFSWCFDSKMATLAAGDMN